MNFNSTYPLRTDFSFTGENFYYIPLTWRLGVSRIEALKIRISNWKPKHSRDNQAVFYFDVTTNEEANLILKSFENYDFKNLSETFDSLYINNCKGKNTEETRDWLELIIPQLKSLNHENTPRHLQKRQTNLSTRREGV